MKSEGGALKGAPPEFGGWIQEDEADQRAGTAGIASCGVAVRCGALCTIV